MPRGRRWRSRRRGRSRRPRSRPPAPEQRGPRQGRSRRTATSTASASTVKVRARVVRPHFSPVDSSASPQMLPMRVVHTRRVQHGRGGRRRDMARTYRPATLTEQSSFALQGDHRMADQPTLDEFRDRVPRLPRGQRHAASTTRRREVRVGRGQRRRRPVRGGRPGRRSRRDLAAAKAWRAKRFDAGLGWITGPKEYGGRELPGAYDRALRRPRGQVRGARPGLLRHRPRHGGPHDPGPRPGPRQGHVPARPCTGATSSAASSSASPAPAPTWPACRPRPSATATSGSSPARRCGPRARTTPTSARSSAAPTPTCPSTRASPASSSTCRRPASRSARCAR